MLRLKPQNSMIRPTMSLTSASLGQSEPRRTALLSLPAAEGTTLARPRRQFGRQDSKHVARWRGTDLGQRRERTLGFERRAVADLVAHAHLSDRLPYLVGSR